VSLFNGPFDGPFLINLVECCSSNAAALWSSAWWLEADPVEKNQKAQEPHSSSSSRASFLPAAGLGLPKELPLNQGERVDLCYPAARGGRPAKPNTQRTNKGACTDNCELRASARELVCPHSHLASLSLTLSPHFSEDSWRI
jgi:hypothetical protein